MKKKENKKRKQKKIRKKRKGRTKIKQEKIIIKIEIIIKDKMRNNTIKGGGINTITKKKKITQNRTRIK